MQMDLTKSKIETSLRRTKDTLSDEDVATARDSIRVESQSVLKKVRQLPSGGGIIFQAVEKKLPTRNGAQNNPKIYLKSRICIRQIVGFPLGLALLL